MKQAGAFLEQELRGGEREVSVRVFVTVPSNHFSANLSTLTAMRTVRRDREKAPCDEYRLTLH